MSKRLFKLAITIIWSLSFGINSLNATEILDSNCEALKYQSSWPNYSKWSKAPYTPKYLVWETTISCRAKYKDSCVVVHSDNTVSLAWSSLADNSGNITSFAKKYYQADYDALKAFRDAVKSGKIVPRSTVYGGTDDRYMVKTSTDVATRAILAKIQNNPTATMFNWGAILDAYQYIVDKVNTNNIDGIKNVAPSILTIIKKPKEMTYSTCAKDLYTKYINGQTITEKDLDGCFAYQAYCTENFALAGIPRDIQKFVDITNDCKNVLAPNSTYSEKRKEGCMAVLKDGGVTISANIADIQYTMNEFNKTMATKSPATLQYFKALSEKYQKVANDMATLIEKVKNDLADEKLKQENSLYKSMAEVTAPLEPNYEDAVTIDDQMKVSTDCIFSNAYSEEMKFGCAAAIEYAFANQLLTAESENKMITGLKALFSIRGEASKWAAIMLGLLANYYPTPEPLYPINTMKSNSNNFIASGASAFPVLKDPAMPSWRKASVRSEIIESFKSCLLLGFCPAATKEGIAKGWGYLGPSAVKDIADIIAVLNLKVIEREETKDDYVNECISQALQTPERINNFVTDNVKEYIDEGLGTAMDAGFSCVTPTYKPGRKFVANDEDADLAGLLFQTLSYIYLTQKDYHAKEVILNQISYSGINETYPYLDNYSITIGVYATFVATYYGIREVEPYLESIATWHTDHSWAGSAGIPIEVSKQAWDAIPKYIKEVKNIPEPSVGTGESIMTGAYYVTLQLRNALAFMVAFELVGASYISAVYGSTAGLASSNIAADVGYIIAARYGTTATYEFTLQLEQRLLAGAFASTTTGKIVTAIMKPINFVSKKFGGSIYNLKSIMFKNKIRLNPAVSEEISLGTGIAQGSGSVFPISENFIAPSTVSNFTKNSTTIYVDAVSTEARITANTYQITAADFAKFGVPKTTNVESLSSIVESIAPKHASEFMNAIKPASNIATGISQSTVGSNGILSTISTAQITNAAGQIINGIRITSTVLGAENVSSASINSLYYQNGTEMQIKMNIEYPDGVTVPVVGEDIEEITKMLNEYNTFCAGLAA